MDFIPSQPIAVIADIHGNSDALRAILDDIDAQGIETIINLGDHFSGPLAASETAELILACQMISIRGNHDRYLIEQSPEDMGPSDKSAFDQLSEVHIDWLRNLPTTLLVSEDIFLCHGTPISDEAYWLENVLPNGDVVMSDYDDIEARANGLSASLILCGHTHVPRAVRLKDGRLILNPGSVGAPGYVDDAPIHHIMQTGTPDASYAIVQKHLNQWQVTFRLIPYNSERMVELAANGQRSEWASALATGWLPNDWPE